ncbi:MAG: hypothetical protein C4581_08085 [Nitrospiraceae bacterium]|nr:MAG: hypothetical protein C4581_08085 [Nitrospiraceae bacterium]
MNPEAGNISDIKLADEIRAAYHSASPKPEERIEGLLAERLKGLTQTDRLVFVKRLSNTFEVSASATAQGAGASQKEMARLVYLLLGKDVAVENLPPEELITKLSQSLNTIFDSLNQIISVINTTLLGERIELATIRQVIGSDMKGIEDHDPLQIYLDQIQEAFLVAHRAFQQAAQARIDQVLKELDPESISAAAGAGFKFGPMRKAEYYDVYTEKFNACKKWFDSGRAVEELLRDFEKICQKSYKKKTRSMS